MLDNRELFERLNIRFGQQPDRKGEVYIACPGCGHPSTRNNVHCSYSIKGFFCFVCGTKMNLLTLAHQVGLDIKDPYIPPLYVQDEKPKRIPSWFSIAQDYVHKWMMDADTIRSWKTYKPLGIQTIKDYKLGVGAFPEYSSKCTHRRLLVPLITGDFVVGVRGRGIDCDCAKWLSAAGSKPVLYNGGQLTEDSRIREDRWLGNSNHTYKPGSILMIVENPIDALMVEERLDVAAVATLGVTIWKEEWEQTIANAKISAVVICYDHDLAGNGGSNEADHAIMVAEWRTKNPQARYAPVPNGIRLANNLRRCGINAMLYKWPPGTPDKFDIGGLLTLVTTPPF